MPELYQSTGQLTGNLNIDADVIARGRVTLTATNQGPGSVYAPYYYVSFSKDIEYLNVSAIRPDVAVWEASVDDPPFELHRKCPYTQWRTGARDIERIVNYSLFVATNKTTGQSLRLIIEMFSSTQNVERTFFYTIYNKAIATQDGSLYPSDGSFS